jgi:HD-like signal output (HDOD) protein
MTDWVKFLSAVQVPVLQRSIDEIERLKADVEKVTVRDLDRVVLDDPMMALKVMSLLQQYRERKSSVSSEVTTFGGVLMMIGIHPFFERFISLRSIEDVLAGDENALDNVLNVIDRSRFAARYAYEMAVRRHDIDPFEVHIATLLHSTAEIMLWCFAPDRMRQIRALSLKYRHMRSARIHAYVMGFTFNELQTAMAQAWKLPELLVELMDQNNEESPRVRTVVIATNLARHSMNGLDDAALPDDYHDISTLLSVGLEEVLLKVADMRENIVSIRREDETAMITGDNRQLSRAYIAHFESVFSEDEREGRLLFPEIPQDLLAEETISPNAENSAEPTA